MENGDGFGVHYQNHPARTIVPPVPLMAQLR